MARATTLVLVAALAVLLLASGPAGATAARTSPKDVATASPNEKVAAAAAEDHECEMMAGEKQRDECMARRTLAAHTDYIYTQEKHN
ncbi:hypothetical protein CFC21_017025 [Triticum aestivum]|uniref:Phytosulfokine n=2 Tax=Triticum aestivum TaxID=4565 RepID=A0A9R1J209_WHEAT|nr:phytosulfokines 4-like [Triticum aestivum]KAF7001330.1 hypothetical protein CFC21_017025 [Triticum aestivum]